MQIGTVLETWRLVNKIIIIVGKTLPNIKARTREERGEKGERK